MEDIFDKVKKSFPKTEGTHQLDGIDDVIEIYWDKWGIPHVYAKSLKDCFFTIGYIHASHLGD
ncbi:MAG: penicillin acylase family protein [Promethearchaeota archaeon]